MSSSGTAISIHEDSFASQCMQELSAEDRDANVSTPDKPAMLLFPETDDEEEFIIFVTMSVNAASFLNASSSEDQTPREDKEGKSLLIGDDSVAAD